MKMNGKPNTFLAARQQKMFTIQLQSLGTKLVWDIMCKNNRKKNLLS